MLKQPAAGRLVQSLLLYSCGAGFSTISKLDAQLGTGFDAQERFYRKKNLPFSPEQDRTQSIGSGLASFSRWMTVNPRSELSYTIAEKVSRVHSGGIDAGFTDELLAWKKLAS